MAVPNVPTAQLKVTAAGQLGQAPRDAAGRYIPAAHVNFTAAGQLAHAPAGGLPAVGPDVPMQPGNDPAQPQIVRDSSSPDNDPAQEQI